MPKDSTNALIMMTAQGDTAAFETLYRQMRKPVYFYALHFCGDHALAEDVMQDTFVTVWGKSSSFTPRGDGRSCGGLRYPALPPAQSWSSAFTS